MIPDTAILLSPMGKVGSELAHRHSGGKDMFTHDDTLTSPLSAAHAT